MIDAICYVLANDRRADTVLRVLGRFLSHHVPIAEDYEDFGVEYASEYDMLHYFQEHSHLAVTRYWKGLLAAPDSATGTVGGYTSLRFTRGMPESSPPEIMVGAHYLTDGHLVVSLTVDEEVEDQMLEELKQFLHSTIGLISYANYSAFFTFDSAAEFKATYDKLQ